VRALAVSSQMLIVNSMQISPHAERIHLSAENNFPSHPGSVFILVRAPLSRESNDFFIKLSYLHEPLPVMGCSPDIRLCSMNKKKCAAKHTLTMLQKSRKVAHGTQALYRRGGNSKAHQGDRCRTVG
jgi:hypothetical protein